MQKLKAHALVDAAGGGEHALGPERDLAVARLARKAHSLLDQSGADAEPARALGSTRRRRNRASSRVSPHPQDPADTLALSWALPLAQPQLPRLADELFAGGVVRLLFDATRRSADLDAAGGGEHALGPERDLAVARLARKAHSLLDQSGADAEPARLRLNQKEA